MTRAEFECKIFPLLRIKIPMWLAEEDTEEGHLENFLHNISAHDTEIRKVLNATH